MSDDSRAPPVRGFFFEVARCNAEGLRHWTGAALGSNG